MTQPLIQMKNIEKHFGSVIALAGVSVDIHAGECHCLLGDNGAGKSTFVRQITGVEQRTRGKVWLYGEEVSFAGPLDAREAGI